MSKIMKTLAIQTIGLAILAFGAVVHAAIVTNQDVVKMVRAGLSEALILQSIESGDLQFDTSSDALIELKKAGVPDNIIQRMIAGKAGTPRPSMPGSDKENCPEGPDTGIEVVENGKRVLLEADKANTLVNVNGGSVLASLFTFGIVSAKGTSRISIDGPKAVIRLVGRNPSFENIVLAPTIPPQNAASLYKVKIENNNRVIDTAEGETGLMGQSGRNLTENMIDLEFAKGSPCLNGGKRMIPVRYKPSKPLQPGEYVFLLGSNSVFSFGVD